MVRLQTIFQPLFSDIFIPWMKFVSPPPRSIPSSPRYYRPSFGSRRGQVPVPTPLWPPDAGFPILPRRGVDLSPSVLRSFAVRHNVVEPRALGTAAGYRVSLRPPARPSTVRCADGLRRGAGPRSGAGWLEDWVNPAPSIS